jgi:hypothetical protein
VIASNILRCDQKFSYHLPTFARQTVFIVLPSLICRIYTVSSKLADRLLKYPYPSSSLATYSKNKFKGDSDCKRYTETNSGNGVASIFKGSGRNG